MPVNLSIKNVPDDVVDGLRARALRHERTLQSELLHILKQAAKDQGSVTMDDLLTVAQRTKPKLDEAASRVLAAHEAEQEQVAKRFEDLLGLPGDDPAAGKK
jgi:antitoxin FitA